MSANKSVACFATPSKSDRVSCFHTFIIWRLASRQQLPIPTTNHCIARKFPVLALEVANASWGHHSL